MNRDKWERLNERLWISIKRVLGFLRYGRIGWLSILSQRLKGLSLLAWLSIKGLENY